LLSKNDLFSNERITAFPGWGGTLRTWEGGKGKSYRRWAPSGPRRHTCPTDAAAGKRQKNRGRLHLSAFRHQAITPRAEDRGWKGEGKRNQRRRMGKRVRGELQKNRCCLPFNSPKKKLKLYSRGKASVCSRRTCARKKEEPAGHQKGKILAGGDKKRESGKKNAGTHKSPSPVFISSSAFIGTQ